MLRGLALWKFVSDICVCMFCVWGVIGFVDWLDRGWIYIYIWEEFGSVYLLITWVWLSWGDPVWLTDIKIQLLLLLLLFFQPTACSLFRSCVRGNRRGHPSHGCEWVNSPVRGLQSRPLHPGLHPTEAHQHRQHLGGGFGGGYPPHDGMGGLHWRAGARWVLMAECSCSAVKALALSQGLTHVYYPFIITKGNLLTGASG